MTWDLLKATGKLIVGLVSIEAKSMLEPVQQHVEKKIAERLKPDLKKIPPESRRWHLLKIGMSEKKVGCLLGLPDQIGEEDIYCDGPKPDIRWEYNPPLCRSGDSGFVTFKNKNLSRFNCQTKDGRLIKGYLYIGSLDGRIFHRYDGPCAKKILPENLTGLPSRTNAIDWGYKPCTKCLPTCDLRAIERDIEDSSDSSLDTSQYPYVASSYGSMFHRAGHPCAERLSPENIIGFKSRADAKNSGYRPCTTCRPNRDS